MEKWLLALQWGWGVEEEESFGGVGCGQGARVSLKMWEGAPKPLEALESGGPVLELSPGP